MKNTEVISHQFLPSSTVVPPYFSAEYYVLLQNFFQFPWVAIALEIMLPTFSPQLPPSVALPPTFLMGTHPIVPLYSRHDLKQVDLHLPAAVISFTAHVMSIFETAEPQCYHMIRIFQPQIETNGP